MVSASASRGESTRHSSSHTQPKIFTTFTSTKPVMDMTAFEKSEAEAEAYNRKMNKVGIALSTTMSVLLVAVVLYIVYYVRRKRNQRKNALAAQQARQASQGSRARRRRERYVNGLPIYLTNNGLDDAEDEDVMMSIPTLDTLPDANAGPALQDHRVRNRATHVHDAQNAHHRSLDSANPNTVLENENEAVGTNPLNPPSLGVHEAEVCVGVVVSSASAEERLRAQHQYFAERDYGAAMYYSQPPVAGSESAEDEEDASGRSTTLVWSEERSVFLVVQR